MDIFSLQGHLVRTLVNEVQPMGPQQAIWDGKDEAGGPVPSGTYFAQLRATGMTETRKLMLLK